LNTPTFQASQLPCGHCVPPQLPQTSTMVRHNGEVKEATRQTLIRRSDEPKLEIGDTVLTKEGVVGVVVARFTRSGESCKKIHYIVELKPDNAEKGRA
jgi:hypothetical protein